MARSLSSAQFLKRSRVLSDQLRSISGSDDAADPSISTASLVDSPLRASRRPNKNKKEEKQARLTICESGEVLQMKSKTQTNESYEYYPDRLNQTV